MADIDIRLVARLRITPGNLDAFKAGVREAADVTHRQDSVLSYEWYLNDAGTICDVLERYADSDAFVTHIRGRVGTEILPKLREIWELEFLYVYGDLSAEAEAEFRDIANDERFALFRPMVGYTR
jgi:quinol monooxygenase YgiN